MQYKQGSEKVDMINTSYIPVSRPLSLTEDPEIQRTRKILLIILSVCLAFSVISTISAISGNGMSNSMQETRRGTQIGQSLISLLFYGFGIFVAYRYYETGLRVFAWLGIVAMVLFGIAIVIILILLLAASSTLKMSDHVDSEGLMIGLSIGIFFTVLICIACLILTIIIVKLSFKLAKLIESKKSLNTQQI